MFNIFKFYQNQVAKIKGLDYLSVWQREGEGEGIKDVEVEGVEWKEWKV